MKISSPAFMALSETAAAHVLDVPEWNLAELMLAMLGVAAKLERRQIKERTARGRADAKAKGVQFGRKPKLSPHQKREAIKRRDEDEETLRAISRSYNVSAQTIGRLSP